MFAVGVTTTCTDIATFDDSVYEDNESFTVSLSSVTENVDITIDTATVLITDNDGS